MRRGRRHVRGVVERLTAIHERSLDDPWTLGDSPAEYIQARLRAIVGIQIEVTRVVGKHKLSQNKQRRDIEAAARALDSRGERIVSRAMLSELRKR